VSQVTAASGLQQALSSLGDTVSRLSELSRRHYSSPYEITWPEEISDEDGWCTSPELTSLHGTPCWDALDDRSRRRLAFFEAANFFSLNIHGESELMAGLAVRLYRPDLETVADYLHHFLDEENKHSIYFGGFCRRYARVYRSRQVSFPGSRFAADQEDFLFFAKTMIFEEIVDYYNRLQGRDPRVHPLARFINANHHAEETRHLVFGRRLVARLWEACAPAWAADDRRAIREYLALFLAMAWREYYNPDVYADCGIEHPWDVAEAAWRSPAQRAHRRTASRNCLAVLRAAGILMEDPADAF